MRRHFEDTVAGGFFFTADDHEALIARPKSFSALAELLAALGNPRP